MKILTEVRFLAFYSGAATALVAVLLLTGFRQQESSKKFESIDVQRINVVEPDGTLRMIISNKSASPGAIIRGKEYTHPDRQSAGILFFNDEATENGGLIFGGAKGKDGKAQSYGPSASISTSRIRCSRSTRKISTDCTPPRSPFGTAPTSLSAIC